MHDVELSRARSDQISGRPRRAPRLVDRDVASRPRSQGVLQCHHGGAHAAIELSEMTNSSANVEDSAPVERKSETLDEIHSRAVKGGGRLVVEDNDPSPPRKRFSEDLTCRTSTGYGMDNIFQVYREPYHLETRGPIELAFRNTISLIPDAGREARCADSPREQHLQTAPLVGVPPKLRQPTPRARESPLARGHDSTCAPC